MLLATTGCTNHLAGGSESDDVRTVVVQQSPTIAASITGITPEHLQYSPSSLDPIVDVSMTSATEAKCLLTLKLKPNEDDKRTFSLHLTKYDSGWKMDNYEYVGRAN